MKRWILNSTTAIAIALSPIAYGTVSFSVASFSAYAQDVESVLKENVKSAREARKAARKALKKAKKDGEGVEAAQQNLDAANAALAEAVNQLEQAREAKKQANQPASEDSGESTETTAQDPEEGADTKKKKKAKKKKKKKNQEVAEPASEEAPPVPSVDAPEAKDIVDAPIEVQIQEAEETPTAVVPDNVTEEQKQKLKAAEKKRRKKARKRRKELLGAAAAGAAVGVLLPELGGRVVEDQGDRLIIERNGQYYVRKDESALFRHGARNVEIVNLRGGRTLETVYRRNGSRVETVRDAGGFVLRRVKISPSGHEHVLFDSRDIDNRPRVDYDRVLPPIKLRIPREEYEVSGGRVGRRSLTKIFQAGPVEEVQQRYSLREVRENQRLRAIVRSVDLDTINFDSGSAAVREYQVPYLADIAGSMLDIIYHNPEAVFLVEGHTDAVGSAVYNIALSDRRAETVARILVEAFGVPPENLVTHGYGEQYLKIPTLADERRNRRVTVRNISALL